jgi:hypothetical protein
MDGFGKVAIGVRVGHAPNAAFFCCWTRLLLDGLDAGDVVLPPAMHLPHAVAANALVGEFLDKTECDSLLFLDDDMTFAPDALRRLRQPNGWAVMSALYATRRAPYTPIAFVRNPEFTDDASKMTEVDPSAGGIVTVDLVGLGFTIIRRPYLRHNIFEWSNGLGEDGKFCRDAQEAGGLIGCNLDVICGHRTEISVYCNVTKRKEQ